MHNKKDKLIAIFLCILLLSNFTISHTLAALTVGNLQVDVPNGDGSVSTDDGKATVTLHPDTDGLQYEQFTFTCTKTGAYKITLRGTKNGNNSASDISYQLLDENGNFVRLAARYANANYYIMTEDTSNDSTTIDVILEAGTTYRVCMNDTLAYNTEYSLTVEDWRLGTSNAIATTNIPSWIVSDKSVDAANAIIESRPLQEAPGDFKIIEFTDEEIQDYILNGADNGIVEEPGGFLEGLLVDIIIVLGTVFMDIVEAMLGSDVKLTIDNIIFNKYKEVIIDLTPLGGINVDSPVSGGIFSNSSVKTVIKTLYDALRAMSTSIYLIMLLYIGVRILAEIGSGAQKKHLKYLEYWVSGLLLLVLIPYCLPAIPAANNALVDMMKDEARKMNMRYSSEEILARLGYDKSYLGEDPEAVALLNLVNEKIDELNEQIVGTSTVSREEAQSGIYNQITDISDEYIPSNPREGAIFDGMMEIVSMIDANYLNWDDELQQKYKDKTEQLKAHAVENSMEASNIKNEDMASMPSAVINDYDAQIKIGEIYDFLKANATKLSVESVKRIYNNNIEDLKKILNANGLSTYYASCVNIINDSMLKYDDLAQERVYENIEKVLRNYRYAMVKEELEVLETMKQELTDDIMTKLKTKAQEDNRLVYAVAWAILLFQMFAVLFLYYKRAITIVILIIIFPVVMAFYVIDKIGDGKSQSLDNWLREFLANVLVQLMHAVLYITIVNAGIEVCSQNPEKNWFFLILAVCFLFPGERILRGILGLNASSLDGLKNNVAGAAAGAVVIAGVAKNVVKKGVNTAKAAKDPSGTIDKYKKEIEKQNRNEELRKEKAKEKKKKAVENSKKLRELKVQMGKANIIDKAMHKYDQSVGKKVAEYKRKINGFKPVQATKAAYGKARNTYRAGKRVAGKALSFTRKAVGLTMGAVEGMENFGEGGSAMTAFTTATQVARDIGGFKPPQSVEISKATAQNQANNTTSGSAAGTSGVGLGGNTSNANVGGAGGTRGSGTANAGGTGSSSNAGNSKTGGSSTGGNTQPTLNVNVNTNTNNSN